MTNSRYTPTEWIGLGVVGGHYQRAYRPVRQSHWLTHHAAVTAERRGAREGTGPAIAPTSRRLSEAHLGSAAWQVVVDPVSFRQSVVRLGRRFDTAALDR